MSFVEIFFDDCVGESLYVRQIVGFDNYYISEHGDAWNVKRKTFVKSREDTQGYLLLWLYSEEGNKTKRIHRLLGQTFIDNPENKECVDHIDGDKKNNNISNLRWATKRENCRNARKTKLSRTSRYKGVNWDKQRNQWLVRISDREGDVKNLGRFTLEKDAARAYNEASIKYHGEFSNLNLISDSDSDSDSDSE